MKWTVWSESENTTFRVLLLVAGTMNVDELGVFVLMVFDVIRRVGRISHAIDGGWTGGR